MLPDNVVQAYYKQVQGASNNSQAGGYTFPCSAQLPSLTIAIGAYNAVIPGELLNFESSGGTCFGGLQSSGSSGLNIFGDIFLKCQYVVFIADSPSPQNGPQIGFAPQA